MKKSETTRMDEAMAKTNEFIKRNESSETAAGTRTHPDRPTVSLRALASALGYSVARAEKRGAGADTLAWYHFWLEILTCLPHCGGCCNAPSFREALIPRMLSLADKSVTCASF